MWSCVSGMENMVEWSLAWAQGITEVTRGKRSDAVEGVRGVCMTGGLAF